MMSVLSNKVQTNNLRELKKYLDETENEIRNNSNSIEYGYDLTLNLYKENTENGVVQVNPSTVLDTMGLGQSSSPNSSVRDTMKSSIIQTNVWTQLLDNEELLKSQYDLLAGTWPKSYNEVVLMVGENNEIMDYTLYTLGIKDQTELKDKMKKIQNGEKLDKNDVSVYSYDDFINLSYKLILNSDYYQKENGIWLDKSEDVNYMKEKVNNAERITVVGIIRANDQSVASTSSGVIGYTKGLQEYVINKSNESEIVKEQKNNKEINIFSGLEFPENTNENFDYSSLPEEQKLAMSNLSNEEIASLMEAYTENKNASYEGNLAKLSAIDLDEPSSIYIYPKDFTSKDNITKAIEDYNQKQKDDGKDENSITYTDIVGTMMKSVSRIINIISYVLIAFVAISLIVSSIMIGIITYISVLERTKEIGILRAIGASKKDISRVFNAETLIVGLIAGIIGIGITVILTIPINSIIFKLTNVKIITAVPPLAGVILIILSVILTIIGGLIPAKLASKRDPVIALRTE